MDPNKRLPVRYEVATYRGPGTEPEVRLVTGEDLGVIDLRQDDHVVHRSRGLLAFRNAAGEWIEKPLSGSGLGEAALEVLEAIQLNPGVFVDCGEIAQLTDNEHYCGSNALAARVKALRRAHGESPRMPRFFFTRRQGGLMWPAERTWVNIRRVKAQPETDAA